MTNTGLVLITAVLMTASTPAPAAETSLYQRLGGMPAIRAVVDGLLANILKDDRVNEWFVWSSNPSAVEGYKKGLADFVCQATGGPCHYQGADMKSTHSDLGITLAAFDAVVEDLTASLDQLKVPSAEKNELLGLLAPLREQIVTK
jgi:hemoglobin